MMNQIDFIKLFEYNKSRGYVFYECGITHKNIEDGLTIDDERLLITKGDMYKNTNICYNVDNINSNEILIMNNDIYNIKNFVINLDNIWEWLGFSQKARAKNLLEKHFILNKDYIKNESNNEQQKKGRGGHNKEVLLMNVKTFNLFCLKADTDISNKIHEYYIRLERLFIKSLDDEFLLFTENTQSELIPISQVSLSPVSNFVENRNIRFIENSFQGVIDMNKQYIFDKYTVDLYFPEYKLIIECDENKNEDKNREKYILSL